MRDDDRVTNWAEAALMAGGGVMLMLVALGVARVLIWLKLGGALLPW